jgi:hypothetical protein
MFILLAKLFFLDKSILKASLNSFASVKQRLNNHLGLPNKFIKSSLVKKVKKLKLTLFLSIKALKKE